MSMLNRREKTTGRRFQMRQKLFAIGDDYWTDDDGGAHVFKVNGKATRFRDTWDLESADGAEVARIKEKALSVRDKIKIHLPDGDATVKKALVGIRDRFHVDVDHGEDLRAHGNVVNHEYKIERNGNTVAEVSKKWFRVRDLWRGGQRWRRPCTHNCHDRRHRRPRPRLTARASRRPARSAGLPASVLSCSGRGVSRQRFEVSYASVERRTHRACVGLA